MLGKLTMALVATALTITPVAAAPDNKAAGLSVSSHVRAGSTLHNKSNYLGAGYIILGSFGVVAAVIIYHTIPGNSGKYDAPDSN